MVEEMVFTSARKGLQIGSSGFCTVASSPGMAVNLARVLQSLSGYRHLYPPGTEKSVNNPVVYSHLTTKVGGRPYSILSRIADAGLDYSNRSNKIAHHFAITLPTLNSVGPSGIFADQSQFFTTWDREAQQLSPRSLTGTAKQPSPCKTWQSVTGDAGWSGDVIEAAKQNRTVYLIVDSTTPAFDLIDELLALLPLEQQWKFTFSTFFTKLPPQMDCRVRCIIKDSAEVALARRSPANLVLDLTTDLGTSTSKLADAARSGFLIGAPINTKSAPTIASSGDPIALQTSVEDDSGQELVLSPSTIHSPKKEPPRIKGPRSKIRLEPNPPKIAKRSSAWVWGTVGLILLTLLVVAATLLPSLADRQLVVKAPDTTAKKQNDQEKAEEDGGDETAELPAESKKTEPAEKPENPTQPDPDGNPTKGDDAIDEKRQESIAGPLRVAAQQKLDESDEKPDDEPDTIGHQYSDPENSEGRSESHIEPTELPETENLPAGRVDVKNQDLPLGKQEQLVFSIQNIAALQTLDLKLVSPDVRLKLKRDPNPGDSGNSSQWNLQYHANQGISDLDHRDAPQEIGTFLVREIKTGKRFEIYFKRKDTLGSQELAMLAVSNSQLQIDGLESKTRYFSPPPVLTQTIKIGELKNKQAIKCDFERPVGKIEFDPNLCESSSELHTEILKNIHLKNSRPDPELDIQANSPISISSDRQQLTLNVVYKKSVLGQLKFKLRGDDNLSYSTSWQLKARSETELNEFLQSIKNSESFKELLGSEIIKILNNNKNQNNSFWQNLDTATKNQSEDLIAKIQQDKKRLADANKLKLQQIIERLIIPVTFKKSRARGAIFLCKHSDEPDGEKIVQQFFDNVSGIVQLEESN
jgi:hypothetical protein